MANLLGAGVIVALVVLLAGLPVAAAAPGVGPGAVDDDPAVFSTTATFDPTVSLDIPASVPRSVEVDGAVTLQNAGERAGTGTLLVRANGSNITERSVTLTAGETRVESIEFSAPTAAGQTNVTASYAGGQARASVTVEDTPPTATIDIPVATASVGDPTQFDATGSTDDDEIVKYSWCFGDGECGLGPTETHTYDAPGTYNVTLTVTDSAGQRDTTSRVITVNGDRGPTAHPECTPSVVVAGETIDCEASGSTAEGSTLYHWQFVETRSDGPTTSTRIIHRGSGVSEKYTFDSPGIYAVRLTVVDHEGATDTTRRAITVEPVGAAPEAALDCSPAKAAASQPVDCVAADSSDDDFLTGYTWDFGDGTTATGDFHTHTYDRPGVYRVSLTVTDTSGLTDTATQVVSVAPAREPNAVMACSPTTTSIGDRIACTATSSNDDADITDYAWEFGDGATGQGAAEVHAYDETGVYPVILTVTDTDGHTDTARTTVAVTDDPVPVADFTYRPKPPSPGTTLTLNASASFDRQSSIARYEWDFNGDGSIDATGPRATRAFDAGPQVVTLTVIDEEGYRSSTEQLLTVASGGGPPPSTQSAQTIDRPTPPEDDSGILLGLGLRAWALLGTLVLSLVGLSYRQFG